MSATPYHHGDLKNALIRAGVEILAEEGAAGLSLRKVATRAGVSHAAPYAHFADKQALIAAISTEGFNQLQGALNAVQVEQAGNPQKMLVETAWAYLQFATTEPEHFKLMFSSVLEKEKNYPEFVEASTRTFHHLVALVETCQAGGVIKPGPADLAAVSLWGAVHGLAMLLLEGQISHTVRDRHSLRAMLLHALNQMTLLPIID